VLFTLVWSGVLTTVLALAIKYTIGWRVDVDDEVEGIDFNQHGETAYELVSSGSGSRHL
jgi:Amt family ammonium transporter